MPFFIPFESLRNIPLSYASCSIGTKQCDTLPRKLEAISAAGFTAIELSFPDILAYGRQITGKELGTHEYAQLVNVTKEIKKLADSNGLQVMMLQPFGNFEGWPSGSRERDDAFRRVKGWMDIMEAAGTDLLQVPPPPLIYPAIYTQDAKVESGRLQRLTRRQDNHRPQNHRLGPARTVRPPCNAQHAPGLRKLVLEHPCPNLERRLGDRESNRSPQRGPLPRHLPNIGWGIWRSNDGNGPDKPYASDCPQPNIQC